MGKNAADYRDELICSRDCRGDWENKGYECRPLHGVYNYVANLHFLYEVAKGASSTQPGNKDKITAYVNGINVQHSSDKSYGDYSIQALRRIIIHACSNSAGMGNDKEMGVTGKSQRIYMMLGIAAHLLGDTYAHRTMVPTDVKWGSSKDNQTFVKNDFTDWTKFKTRVTANVIEFRDIKSYLKNVDANNYTDKTDFYSNRYKGTKKAVANLFKRFGNNNTFSVKKFYHGDETGFGRLLNNLSAYAISAGYSDDLSQNSTKEYRVDFPNGSVRKNERDYVDYKSFVYK